MDLDGSPNLADDVPEATENTTHTIHARAYQLEMFEHSMQRNTIVTMDTGSGKTQIAKLRIEAELERSPSKMIWFCAPSVVLAQQQFISLLSQLTAYSFRLITGLDNVQFWSTQEVWSAVLANIDVVVSTPQVLLDALGHAFVSLRNLSLLVFDEAHHCISKSPMAKIMQNFYLKDKGNDVVPHILGLTASPITNSAAGLTELETNMSAICKAPTRQLEEYKQHIHLPKLETIVYSGTMQPQPDLLNQLGLIVHALEVEDDPSVKWWKESDTYANRAKLEKTYRRGYTAVMKQMRSFLGNAEQVYSALGAWATCAYIKACVSRLFNAVQSHESVVTGLAEEQLRYMSDRLQGLVFSASDPQPAGAQIAPKCQSVIDYLIQHYQPGVSAIVFVQRRSIAFMLTELLKECSQIKDFRVFSFVGASNPAHRTLMDLADAQIQGEAFADFKAGKQNVCVATSVMEEGVDVQAVNLVIRFDEPQTFRAYVQSRGRARQSDSRFIIVQPTGQPGSTLDVWGRLEEEMKKQYADEKRLLADRESIEREDESSDDFYRVNSTGAVLSHDNARQHLEHFVSTLSLRIGSAPQQPIFLINGVTGEAVSAEVRLPSSITPSLQVTTSLRSWRSEKAAIRDAAFQCYKKLHTAGLVNDNLLPFRPGRTDLCQSQPRNSTYQVSQEFNPWRTVIDNNTSSSQLRVHRLQVSNDSYALPSLLILMPILLDHELDFWLRGTPLGDLKVKIVPQHEATDVTVTQAFQISEKLFSLVLGRRLKRFDMNSGLPYLIVPDMSLPDLCVWATNVMAPATELTDLVFNSALQNQSYLIRVLSQEILYRWSPSFISRDVRRYNASETISASRLTKQMYFLTADITQQEDDHRILQVSDCLVENLSAAYGELMILMPSIMHVVEVTLRGQAAVSEGPLSAVGFSSSKLVVRALTASSASADRNYEQLEFLGDALLKYYTTVSLFLGFPLLPESVLTTKRQSLVSNTRLQNTTKDLGLAAHLTTERFASQTWTLDINAPKSSHRDISSKTLADTIEALLGAAFLDRGNSSNSDLLILSALSTFLPEANWQPPSKQIPEFRSTADRSIGFDVSRLTQVEQMLSYRFKDKTLLAEALTRTSTRAGVSSYERLEFLGDAVIDRVIATVLYAGRLRDAGQMTTVHHALANHHILAFLGMELQCTVALSNVETTQNGRVRVSPRTKMKRLINFVSGSLDKAQIQQQREAESTYSVVCDQVRMMLKEGTTMPSVFLQSINAPKVYSDVVESIIGAVYIDSCGDLSTCEQVLEVFGLMAIARRLSAEPDIESRSPVEILRLREASVKFEAPPSGRSENGSREWRCTISLNDQVLSSHVSNISKSHAENSAAELALTALATRGSEHQSNPQQQQPENQEPGSGIS